MARALRGVMLAAVCAPWPAMAAPAGFSGTWKTDLASLHEPKPYVLGLKDGVFSCQVCEPQLRVPADGRPHPVAANPYADAVAIKVVDARTMAETDVKDGKTAFTSVFTVAAGGKTASYAFVQQAPRGGAPVTGKTLLKRVAAGAPGSHAVAGTWAITAYAGMSASGLMQTLKLNGDEFSLAVPDGTSFTARLNGGDAPFVGDPGTSVASVSLADGTLRITGKRDGKVVWIRSLTLAPDGRTMRRVFEDKVSGMTVRSTATRQ